MTASNAIRSLTGCAQVVQAGSDTQYGSPPYGALLGVGLPVSIDVWPRSHLSIPKTNEEVQIVHRSRRTKVHLTGGKMILFNKGMIHRGVGRGAPPEVFPFTPFPDVDPSIIVVSNDNYHMCLACAAPTSERLRPTTDRSPPAEDRFCPKGNTYCLDCFEAIGTIRLHSYVEEPVRSSGNSATTSKRPLNSDSETGYRQYKKKGDMYIQVCSEDPMQCRLCSQSIHPDGVDIYDATEASSSLADDGWVVFDADERLMSDDILYKIRKRPGNNSWDHIFNNYESRTESRSAENGIDVDDPPGDLDEVGDTRPTKGDTIVGRRWMNSSLTDATAHKPTGVWGAVNHCVDIAKSLLLKLGEGLEHFDVVFMHTDWYTPDQDPHRDWPRNLARGPV